MSLAVNELSVDKKSVDEFSSHLPVRIRAMFGICRTSYELFMIIIRMKLL
jgi:hypothetical protein